jgi:hypothetical protein
MKNILQYQRNVRNSLFPQEQAKQKEYPHDKEQTSYDDLLDALRLSLKGYNIG